MSDPVRTVLIVDDSKTVRSLLRVAIEGDPRLTVVGEAADPYEARQKIKLLNPEVLTLDVEMPRMNGLNFLKNIMRLRPMPVVMVSSRTQQNSAEAVHALSLGAVDCVDAASLSVDPLQRARLLDTLHMASIAQVRGSRGSGSSASRPVQPEYRWNGKIALLGSSTGGVDAVERILRSFPADGPPMLIAQHMPAAFLKSFAARLNQNYHPTVRIAEDGDHLRQGEVLIAPGGDYNLTLDAHKPDTVRLVRSEPSDTYVPSVDRLFASAVPVAKNCVICVLTGMGSDGATPLPTLRRGGAWTMAQRGDTCVVDGMPRAARQTGAVADSPPLSRIGANILRVCEKVLTE